MKYFTKIQGGTTCSKLGPWGNERMLLGKYFPLISLRGAKPFAKGLSQSRHSCGALPPLPGGMATPKTAQLLTRAAKVFPGGKYTRWPLLQTAYASQFLGATAKNARTSAAAAMF
eukprot:SAG11_NODE_8149_length_1054_cov_5.673298_1_plen_115_part_00